MKKYLIALIWILTASCRQSHDEAASGVQSLENFAAGKTVVENRCGVTRGVPASMQTYAARVDAPSTAARDEVLMTLAAVPSNLRDGFFQLGGTINVTPDPSALCSNAKMTEAEQAFAGDAVKATSCWIQPAPGAFPMIVIKADQGVIRHDLVRQFSYFFSEMILPRANLKEYELAKARLAKAFLQDLDAQGVEPTQRDRLTRFHQNEAARFGGFVLAEAVDSYYCSKASKSNFKRSFKASYKVFTTAAEGLDLNGRLGKAWFE